MSNHLSRLVVGCIGFFASAMVVLAAWQPPARIEVQVALAPTPVTGGDGGTYLAYELLVTNASDAGDVRLERVEAFGAMDTTPLVSYSGADLDQRVMRPGADRGVRYGRLIRSGMTALVHMWVALGKDRAAPRSLRHSFVFLTGNETKIAAGEATVEIHTSAPPVIGSPFRGGRWWAHNGPGQHRSAHWGSVLVDQRGARIPQRYAIDFIGLDDNGSAVRRDVRKSTNEDWIGFGREIVAVVDGMVQDTRDGVADNDPLVDLPPVQTPSAADTYGNYVIVRAADRRFVHYAHLQRNSVAVKTGQTVRRGQVIGRVGNSGNTNGAHLHFNITDDASPEAAQGLPFVFEAFESLGDTTADIALGAEPPSGKPGFTVTKRVKALPLDGTVVRFP